MKILNKDVSNDYIIGNVIGKGSFSIVSECTCKKTDKKFAVKTISKRNLTDSVKQCVYNEIKILQKCRHKNVASVQQVYESSTSLHIVMELVDDGELLDYVLERGSLNESEARELFLQIVEGVKYLHSMKISHRDLKLENILITKQREIKLSDFGLSKLIESPEDRFMKTRCGTPAYVAPEVLLATNYTEAVDIWSLGVVLFTILTGEFPFQGNSMEELYENIIAGHICFPEDCSFSLLLKDLIEGLLTPEPEERLTIKGIQNHLWMQPIHTEGKALLKKQCDETEPLRFSENQSKCPVVVI